MPKDPNLPTQTLTSDPLSTSSLSSECGLKDFYRITLKFKNKSLEKEFKESILFGKKKFHEFYPMQGKHFFLSFYGTMLVYILMYILVYATDNLYSKIFEFQVISLALVLIFSIIIFCLSYHTRIFRKFRIDILQFNYFSFGVFLILNNPPVQVAIFGDEADVYISSLPGLLVILGVSKFVLYTNYFEFGITNICLAIIYLISHLPSKQSLITTLLELAIYVFQIVYETAKFYQVEVKLRYHFQLLQADAELEKDNGTNDGPKSEIEEVTSWLIESLELIESLISQASAASKLQLARVLELLNKTSKTITSKRNIYSTDIEIITKHMDKDDREFIKQAWSDQNSLNSKSTNRIRVRKTSELFKLKAYDVFELNGILRQIGKNWNFDTFFLKECTENKPLLITGKYCAKKYRLDEAFSIQEKIYIEFFEKLESLYKQNPYHNSTHAADVLASFLYITNKSCLSDALLEVEILASIIANLGHDVAHPGFTNRFLINKKDELAIRYNDASVLESMHCSTIFQIVLTPETNIFISLDKDQWIAARKFIVEMILATDMGRHFDLLGQFRAKIMNNSSRPLETPENRIDVLRMTIKAADIGHAAKVRELHERWSVLVVEEFFNQGDIEKTLNQPISMYCDRDTTDISKSQAGFIKNIALPLYEALNSYLISSAIDENCIEQLKINQSNWEFMSNKHRMLSHCSIEPSSDYQELVNKYIPLRRGSTHTLDKKDLEDDPWIL
ncbi:unnamed protein product [Blepharisma stoltei]|uniref:Phosphodiesterase n=1 Tax=Blepharisma stoltei TaxID=1481888 RepID=A0AAU9IXB8_9CILI|nr:unnamed protein product [Blepharisma stoltei]